MALTQHDVDLLIAVHRKLRALDDVVENLYIQPATYDAIVNEAIIMLHHSVRAARWASHNASIVAQNAYAPGWEDQAKINPDMEEK